MSHEFTNLVEAVLALSPNEKAELIRLLAEDIGHAHVGEPTAMEYGAMEVLDRITQQPDMMEGKACIRGQQVTVGMVVGLLSACTNVEEVLAKYPSLEREDVVQALRYAAWRADERGISIFGKSGLLLLLQQQQESLLAAAYAASAQSDRGLIAQFAPTAMDGLHDEAW